MRKCLILLLLLACAPAPSAPEFDFVVEPYVQLGNVPRLQERESLKVLWGSRHDGWTVRYGDNRTATPGPARSVVPDGAPPFTLYEASLEDLAPGSEVEYRLERDGTVRFQSRALARQSARQKVRFAVFGDFGNGSSGARAIAAAVEREKPDALFLAGDLIYSRGRTIEYLAVGFPVYGRLMARRVWLPAPGNHDLTQPGKPSRHGFSDPYAYYVFWDLPLNGPGDTGPPDPGNDAFRAAAGERFPRMANYSVDWGPVHWVMLDGTWSDWSREDLRRWLVADLAETRQPWRFAVVHQPPFNSSRHHAGENHTRHLAEVLQENGVQVVFSGHVHNYQRSHPIRYEAQSDTVQPGSGVLYLISGAAGAPLADGDQNDRPGEFTAVLKTREHSYTLCEVDGEKLTGRQLTAEGAELDRFERALK